MLGAVLFYLQSNALGEGGTVRVRVLVCLCAAKILHFLKRYVTVQTVPSIKDSLCKKILRTYLQQRRKQNC
jgi:hypothetical protein